MKAGEGIIGRGKGMCEGPELGNNRALTEYNAGCRTGPDHREMCASLWFQLSAVGSCCQ